MKNSMRIALFLISVFVLASSATAQELRIVALGASQTEGKGVSESDAYPAQLERLLKDEGYSAKVVNEGFSGETTQHILDRMNRAVSDSTRIVILQPGTNDKVRTNKRNAVSPEETRKNVEQILANLKERNITVILLGYPGPAGREIAKQYSAIWYGQPNKDITPDMIQGDGQHFTKEGYAVLAKNLSVIIKKILGKSPKL